MSIISGLCCNTVDIDKNELTVTQHDTATKSADKVSKDLALLFSVTPEGSLTHPRNHSSARFSYLVHALSDEPVRLMQLIAITAAKGCQEGQNIDLLTQPEKLAEKKVISCSLIDQDKSSTFSDVGLILNCPPENIVGMSSSDAGTNFAAPDQVVSSRQPVLKTPQELLQETSKGAYNEVVITGKSNTGTVSIIGCFVKTANGRPRKPEKSSRIRELACRLSVPVVEIDETVSFADSKTQVLTPSLIAFNRGGERYLFDLKHNLLTVYESLGQSRIVSSRDVLKALYILNQELADNPILEEVNAVTEWNWVNPFIQKKYHINSEAIMTGVKLLQNCNISIDNIHNVYNDYGGSLRFEFEEGTDPSDIAQIQERISELPST